VGTRRLGRELALQMLYALDMNPWEEYPSLPRESDSTPRSYESLDFAEELVRGVRDKREEIDSRIAGKSRNWSIARMSRVDLNILRLAIFELLFRADIPRNVTINEAVEIAKKFGTEDSPAFVNGILDEVAAGLECEKSPEQVPGE
jgi:N utilization substance protein B